MRHIDVIRDVKLKANGQWQNILSNLEQRCPNMHTACPHCSKDRFRFDNKDSNGTFVYCNPVVLVMD